MKLRPVIEPDLSPTHCAMVLGGWRARPPFPHEWNSGEALDLFAADGPPHCGRMSAELWQRHEAYLRKLAKQWRWEPMCGPNKDLFWGEHCARRGRDTDPAA